MKYQTTHFCQWFFLLLLCITLNGCGHIPYLIKQGMEQIQLITLGQPNHTILKTPDIPNTTKNKIKQIEQYKAFFYQYFNQHPKEIYSKTLFLERDAASYLLISAPYDDIRPHLNCFPIFGCFPYLGFFDLEDAKQQALIQKKQGFSTFITPVYAYSTMGYFNDRILSSFFKYNQIELAEVIFHELFHTLFFVKNEVELNEQLATFYAKELTRIYFHDQVKRYQQHRNYSKKSEIFNKIMSQSTKKISKKLKRQAKKQNRRLSPKQANHIIHSWLKNHTLPKLKTTCLKRLKQPCNFSPTHWNTARLVAFTTYFNDQDKITKLMKDQHMDLKSFLDYLNSRYRNYQQQNHIQSFKSFLFKKA